MGVIDRSLGVFFASALTLAVAPACTRHVIGSSGGSSDTATGGGTTADSAVCGAGGGSAADAAPTLDALKACLSQGATQPDCLDAAFHGYMQSHTTSDALALLQCFMDHDNELLLQCHVVAHSIGRETFLAAGTVDGSFKACDQTCHSGCYHGAMERFLRGATAGDEGHLTMQELQDKAATACNPSLELRYRFQCLHGLGHAIMYFSDYDLRDSLKICDATGDQWTQSSCYGGVFMENVVAADPSKRDLSSTDYQYPCDSVDTQYRSDCYLMQTSRMFDMGLGPSGVIDQCNKAAPYTDICIQSMGRDLSDQARAGTPRQVSSTCEQCGSEVQACTRGVIYAVIDNTWDGRYAFPYCASYANDDAVTYCFQASVDYLRTTYAKTNDDLAQECAQYAPQSSACHTATAH
jgi:hypothetical protein